MRVLERGNEILHKGRCSGYGRCKRPISEFQEEPARIVGPPIRRAPHHNHTDSNFVAMAN